MGTKDALYEIVRSLKPNEKRYFRLYAGAFREHSRLIKLFDSLDQENMPSEADQTTAVGGKGLKAARSDLRKLVLKSMRNFHEANNSKIELQAALVDIEFLRSKQLYDEAEKEFRKALKKAEEQLDYQAQLALLFKSIEFQKNYASSQALHEEQLKIRQQLTQLTQMLATYGNLNSLSTEWGRYITKFDQRDIPKQKEYFDQQLAIEIEQFRQQELSPHSMLVLNQLDIHYAAMFATEVPNDALIQTTLQLFEQEPSLKQQFFPIYFSTLYNYSSALYREDKYAESLQIINRLKPEFQGACAQTNLAYSAELRVRHRYALLSGQLRSLCGLKRHSECLGLIEEYHVLKNEGLGTPNLTTSLLIQVRIASVHFHLGQYKNSLAFISKLLMHDGIKNVRAIYWIALYAEALCLYMMGSIDLAESRLTNLYRVIMAKENGDVDGITEMQLKFIRSIHLLDFNSKAGRAKVEQLMEALQAEKTDNFWAEFIFPAEWLRGLLKQTKSSS